MARSLDSRLTATGGTQPTAEAITERTIGREFLAPLDAVDIEAIESRFGIGIHSEKHDLRQHLTDLRQHLTDPSDSLVGPAEKTATHDGVGYMSASRFSELTNDRDDRAPAQVFFNLLHTPEVRRRQATSNDRLGWLNRGVVATDASNLSLKAPITVPSEFREIDEDCEITPEDGGLKLHLALRVDGECKQPLSAVVTPPNDHETTQFDHLQEDVEVVADLDDPIGVWDRGYTDYDRFVERKRAGEDFVTTFKSNANTTIVEPLEEVTIHDEDGTWQVVDDIIELGETGETFPRVTVTDPEDEVTEYLTTLPAAGYAPIDVMEIYTLRTMT